MGSMAPGEISFHEAMALPPESVYVFLCNEWWRLDVAERGYAVRSAREVRMREWLSLREEGEKPGDFKRLVNVLRAKKWAKANPERVLELHRLWDRRHRPEATARVKKWRHARVRELVFTCASRECEVQWCRVPGGKLHGNIRPIYCSRKCFNRERYLRRLDPDEGTSWPTK